MFKEEEIKLWGDDIIDDTSPEYLAKLEILRQQGLSTSPSKVQPEAKKKEYRIAGFKKKAKSSLI